ncbi:MAG TPA: DegT/DnrJ/EryC1/StrS family aminotransferase [Armatimonadota bacterium]|nr:DegT/DnrJ/EryC1/StrS family aminotransferase [Armatimonadota bacterium]
MGKLALTGGKPVGAVKPAAWPVIDEEDRQAVLRVLESHEWCRLWEESEAVKFEQAFAGYQETKHCVAVSNGTVAIELALLAAGIEAGDEVIVPAVTFIATASAVSMVNAVPVFVDIVPETCQIDPAAVEAAITPRTKAIIGVHYGGYPVDFDRLLPIAKKHDLVFIEDCAHAHGTEWKGRKVGALGTAGTFSFQMSKSLPGGEGGAVLMDDDALYEQARLLHNIGRGTAPREYGHVLVASNYRMSEFQAAVLSSQLKKLPAQVERKHENGEWLASELEKIGGLRPLKRDPRITKRGYYFFVMRYDPEQFQGAPRERFAAAIEAEGMDMLWEAYQMPLYANRAFQKAGRGNTGPVRVPSLNPGQDYDNLHLPVSERFCYEEQLVMGHEWLLSERAELQKLVRAVAKVKENAAELVQ